jgi:hypothetical protein
VGVGVSWYRVDENGLRCGLNHREICIADVEHWCCLAFIHCERKSGGSRGFSQRSETTLPHCHPIRYCDFQQHIAEQALLKFKAAVDTEEWDQERNGITQKAQQMEDAVLEGLSVETSTDFQGIAKRSKPSDKTPSLLVLLLCAVYSNEQSARYRRGMTRIAGTECTTACHVYMVDTRRPESTKESRHIEANLNTISDQTIAYILALTSGRKFQEITLDYCWC